MNELQQTGGETNLSMFPAEKIELIKQTVAQGATDNELEMFLHLAARYKLDPFAKEIWFIKRAKKEKGRNNQWDYKRHPDGSINYEGAETVIMTSRDGYLKAAQQDPDFLGLYSFEIRKNDSFSMNVMSNEINHTVSGDRGPITGAYAVAKHAKREPVIVYVDFAEYSAAANSPTWKKYPSAMIKKVAEAQALKRQFGLSGLVTKEEMAAEYDIDSSGRNQQTTAQPPAQPPRSELQVIEGNKKDPAEEWKRLSNELKANLSLLNTTPQEAAHLFSETLDLPPSPKEWTLAEMQQAHELIENMIDDAFETSLEKTAQ